MGFQTSDDAGVYQLDEATALVLTADIITPPVDDPYIFGQIGAANSLSDVYAMGGRPLACLSLVGFPSQVLEPDILQGITAGAVEKIAESGAVLVGGHTTEDEEPKFGLSVTGVVHPQRIWRNSGAVPGDLLILTKPIGSGVLFNANLKGWVSEGALERCLSVANTLNRTSAESVTDLDIHAATDISGFGLAGHALEMARASGVQLEINIKDVPLLDEALKMYRRGVSTGINRTNRELIQNVTRFDHNLPAWHEEVTVDPQTSGGILFAVAANDEAPALAKLRDAGVDATTIGKAIPYDEPYYLAFV